jgi:hypothetical protein
MNVNTNVNENGIKYGRIFKINYDDEFEKFNSGSSGGYGVEFYNLNNNGKERKIKKNELNVYHLECLEILSLENWNKCFRLDKARKIIDINYPYFGEICCDLQKSLKGTLNFTGKSFTNEPLIPGDLETYYFQYMAQQLFGSHVAFHGFQNLAEIKKKISYIPKQIIKVLQERKILKEFYKIFDSRQNLEKNLNYNLENNLFENGDVLEVSIFFKKPELDIHSPSDILATKFEYIKNNFTIKDSLWKIYFILL